MNDFEAQLERFFYDPDEDVTDLLELGEEAAAPAVGQEPLEEYLTFALGEERFLVPLIGVREVGKVPVLTEIPHAPHGLLGVMGLRGELLPVYDPSCLLGMTPRPRELAQPDAKPMPREARVLVLYTYSGDAGLLVDRLLGVVRLPHSAFSQPGPGVVRSGRASVMALGHHDGKLHCLLDVQELLA